MATRKIDLPPAVTQALVGLGAFVGRHVAEGVKKTRASAFREIGEALKRAGAVLDEASREEDGDRSEPEVVVETTPKPGGHNGRR
jgi:hypothetical protein